VRQDHCFAEQIHVSAARLLLAYGAKPYVTELLFHSKWLSLSIIKLLLCYDVDLNQYFYEKTILMELVTRDVVQAENPADTIKLFLGHGADPFLKNNDGKTALQFAEKAKNSKSCCLLLVAMYLKNRSTNSISNKLFSMVRAPFPYLKKAHDYCPIYFETLIKDIIVKNIWPWVTKKMKQRLLNDPVVKSLDLVSQTKKEMSHPKCGA